MAQFIFDHVHLVSKDPETSAKFYEDFFEAKRVLVGKDATGLNMIQLTIGDTRLIIRAADEKIKLIEDSPQKRYGLEHFCIRVDNLEAVVANMKRKNVKFLMGITQLPKSKVANVMAPDNIKVEVLQRNEPK